MMKLRSFLCVLLAAVLLPVCCCSAGAEGLLRPMIQSAQTLLFSTENVTLRGHAVFSLDGERFKTADILYKQDGENSHWQLDLLTPRPFRSDRETGYTIIANSEKIYVMERYYPGVYRTGTDQPDSTVVGRSLQADRLFSLALDLADPLESFLPQGALSLVSEDPEGREIQIALSGDNVPDLLNSGLNLAAEYALRRFMNVDYDREHPQTRSPFGDYPTVTRSVIYATDSFVLSDASVRVRLDAENRLDTASGSLSALLTVNGDRDKLLEITFDLSAGDYGSTTVPAFDPDQFGVIPAGSGAPAVEAVDSALAEKLHDLAVKCLKAAGKDPGVLLYDHTREDDGFYRVVFVYPENGATVIATFNADGALLALTDEREPYYTADPREPSVMTLPEEDGRMLGAFLEQAFPELASRCASFIPIMEYSGLNSYLYVTAEDASGEDTGAAFILLLGPETEIAAYHFDVGSY